MVVFQLSDSLVRWTGRGESGKPSATAVWKEKQILERFLESVEGTDEGVSQLALLPKHHCTWSPTRITTVDDGTDLRRLVFPLHMNADVLCRFLTQLAWATSEQIDVGQGMSDPVHAPRVQSSRTGFFSPLLWIVDVPVKCMHGVDKHCIHLIWSLVGVL